MIIKDIRSKQNDQTRTDGRYPDRIGCRVRFVWQPENELCMWLEYEADNRGRPKDGYLRTSIVTSVSETDADVIVETMNSVYVLTKV